MTTSAILSPNQPFDPSALAAPIDSCIESITHKSLPLLTHDWKQLSATGKYAEPFFQPEWFVSFANTFALDRHLIILAARSNSNLIGIAPFMQTDSFFGKVPARTYRSLSGIHSCRYDLIHNQNTADSVCESMWEALREDSSWDVIEALDVPDDGSFTRLLRNAQDDGFLCGAWPTRKSPYLHIPCNGDSPFQNCPNNGKQFRSRLQGKTKKLSQQTHVSFEVETTEYEKCLQEFITLESSGWKGANRSAIASNPITQNFYTSMIEALTRLGCLRIYSLRVGSNPIAMHLGLTMNGVYYAPKVTYDESFARFSPGHLLVQHIIPDLAAHGIHTYDFLGARTWWKSIWAPLFRSHSNYYIFRPTLKGRCLHALTMNGARYLRKIRHRLYGDPQEVK